MSETGLSTNTFTLPSSKFLQHIGAITMHIKCRVCLLQIDMISIVCRLGMADLSCEHWSYPAFPVLYTLRKFCFLSICNSVGQIGILCVCVCVCVCVLIPFIQ